MKIGLVYNEHRARFSKFNWVRDALVSLGHETAVIENIHQLAAADWECDFLLFEQRVNHIGHKQVRAFKRSGNAAWLMWWWDLIQLDRRLSLEQQQQFQTWFPLMRAMDLTLVKERDIVRELMTAGIECCYLDQGCPDDWPECNHRSYFEYDVVTWGKKHRSYVERHRDVAALIAAGYRVAWAGDKGGVPRGCDTLPVCDVRDLHQLISIAPVSLCVDYRSDVDGYWSDRLWQAAGSGTCVVSRGGSHPKTSVAFCYDDTESMVQSMGKLINRYKSAGSEAREIVMQNHTYTHRCQELIEHATAVIAGNHTAAEAAVSQV